MKISELRRKYPEQICICCPHIRDAGSRRVESWTCLQVVGTSSAAQRALERFEKDGVMDAAAIPTGDQVLRGALAARYYRIFNGLEP